MSVFDAAGRWGDELAQELAAGADPTARDEGGRTPLHFAARVDDAHVQLLLDAGADPNARDARGLSPLHFAASVGGRTIATLLAAGAAVDPADENGHTPLLHALHGAWIEAASALLATDAAILAALLGAGARSELDAEERRLLGRAADRQQAAIAATLSRTP